MTFITIPFHEPTCQAIQGEAIKLIAIFTAVIEALSECIQCEMKAIFIIEFC